MKYDLSLENATYLAPDMTLQKGTIAISNGNIALIDPTCGHLDAKTIIKNDDLVWLPGFTDGHIHTSQQLLKGRLLDEKPVIWKRVNVPFENTLDEEASRVSAQFAALELLSVGSTGIVDAGGKYPEIFAEVFEQAGIKARVSVMTNDNPGQPDNLRTRDVPSGVKRLREMKAHLEGLRLIHPIYSVTTPIAASESLTRAVIEAAIQDDVPFETHMNEYASEVTQFIERYGERPFLWLEKEGYLGKVPFIAPHCIFLTPSEKRVMEENDVRVFHCPFSNCGKGVPETPDLLERGISVGFGSDGAAHGGLDLFREMRLFRGVMNATRGVATADSSIMSAETLLKMATQGGAKGLCGKEDGCIKAGSPADMIAIDTDQPHLWGSQNMLHSLVESASGQDVVHVVTDGTLRIKDRTVLSLDQERIKAEAKELFAKRPRLQRW